MENGQVKLVKRLGTGLSIIVFPIMLLIGFVLHPNIFSFELIPAWQGVVIIVELLLLINPYIEIISSIGAMLMCIGLIPIGLRELKGSLG